MSRMEAKVAESKIFFHVMHSRGDGKWHVKPGNEETVVAYESKEQAINKAIELAESITDKQQRHVIIHKTNGAFETVKNV